MEEVTSTEKLKSVVVRVMSVNAANSGDPNNAANEACRRLVAEMEVMLFSSYGADTPDVVENVANVIFPEGADPQVIAELHAHAHAHAHARGHARGFGRGRRRRNNRRGQ